MVGYKSNGPILCFLNLRRSNFSNAQVIEVHFVYIIPSKENKRTSPLYNLIASSATIVSASSPTAGIGMFKYFLPATPLAVNNFPIILLHLYVAVRERVNDML